MSYAAIGATPKMAVSVAAQPKVPYVMPWWGWPAGALAIGVVFTIIVHAYDKSKSRA